MYYKPLAERTKYFKETTEGVRSMCKIIEDMRNEVEARMQAIIDEKDTALAEKDNELTALKAHLRALGENV